MVLTDLESRWDELESRAWLLGIRLTGQSVDDEVESGHKTLGRHFLLQATYATKVGSYFNCGSKVPEIIDAGLH